MPSLSVVIPTRHRPDILLQTLQRLNVQTIAGDMEVIVVHDGQDDGNTWQMMDGMKSTAYRLEYFSIPKAQQGAARNKGVMKTQSPIILFMGDDIFLDPNACEAHVAAHAKHGQCAVLGFTTWDPECGISKPMRWLERVGWQFGYPMIDRYRHGKVPKPLQAAVTYTSHISVPAAIAKQVRFREDVTLYGWEDIEWGTRLRDSDLPLIYESDARGLHHHHLEMKDSLLRMEQIGRSAVTMEKINPSMHIVPRGAKRLIYNMISYLPTMWGKHAKAFLRGIESAA